MPKVEDALYPGGPKEIAGNEDDPRKVLNNFGGNHEGALAYGEPKHREAYVQVYGYERTLNVIDKLLAKHKDNAEAKDWFEDMSKYKADLLGRQAM